MFLQRLAQHTLIYISELYYRKVNIVLSDYLFCFYSYIFFTSEYHSKWSSLLKFRWARSWGGVTGWWSFCRTNSQERTGEIHRSVRKPVLWQTGKVWCAHTPGNFHKSSLSKGFNHNCGSLQDEEFYRKLFLIYSF